MKTQLNVLVILIVMVFLPKLVSSQTSGENLMKY